MKHDTTLFSTQIYQNENICRDLKAKVQSAQGALQKWQYLVGKNMVAVQCFSGYYISHIQRDSESMKEATEKSMADELLTTYSLLEDLRAALAHQAAFLGGIEIEGGSFMAEKRILADLQKFMMVVTGQSDTATTIRAFHQRTAVLDTVIRVFPAYAEETFAALRTEVELRTTDFFATKQGPVAIVGRLGSNAVDYMVIFSQALQEKAAKNLEYRNECLRDLRQQVDTWHTLLPNFISNSFTFLRSKAEEDSIAFRKLQSTSYSQLKETLRSRKDTNWSKLVPSLGHPQNIGKLQDLDVEEAARAKQTLDAVQAYTTRIRDNFTATSHKYHEWNVYVADALFGLLDEAVQQEDLERDVTAVIPSDESTKQTMERSSRRAIAAELIRQQREREEKSKLEPQSDRIPEEPAVENPVDVVIVADVPSKRQVIYEQFTLLADSERPLVLWARSTELHRLVAAECARNALRYEEFLGRALQEMDTVLCSTTDEETVWAGKWRASVAKIKSIYQ